MSNDKLVGVSSNEHAIWKKGRDYIEKISTDQRNFIQNNQEVQQAELMMLASFTKNLFLQNKNQFMDIEEHRQLCSKYVDTMIKVSNEYSDNIIEKAQKFDDLESKFKKMEQELEKLKTKKGAKSE